MDSKWFVVQTNPREDDIAIRFLRSSGILVYQPLMERYVFHARKKTLKLRPLFPSYLFINILPTEEVFHKVRWCRGIRRVLIDNYTPVPIDEGFINALKSVEEEGVIKKPTEYKHGDVIRVKSGPMKDVYGIFDTWESDEGRVKILVELVNNYAKVTLHHSLIEKA